MPRAPAVLMLAHDAVVIYTGIRELLSSNREGSWAGLGVDHGKERKTHGTDFAVRILPKRTAKGARRIFTR
jgi:hypothetical protein